MKFLCLFFILVFGTTNFTSIFSMHNYNASQKNNTAKLKNVNEIVDEHTGEVIGYYILPDSESFKRTEMSTFLNIAKMIINLDLSSKSIEIQRKLEEINPSSPLIGVANFKFRKLGNNQDLNIVVFGENIVNGGQTHMEQKLYRQIKQFILENYEFFKSGFNSLHFDVIGNKGKNSNVKEAFMCVACCAEYDNSDKSVKNKTQFKDSFKKSVEEACKLPFKEFFACYKIDIKNTVIDFFDIGGKQKNYRG